MENSNTDPHLIYGNGCKDYRLQADDCKKIQLNESDHCKFRICTKYVNCENKSLYGASICQTHQCQIENCERMKFSEFCRYCAKHKCCDPYCGQTKHTPSQYCVKHECANPNCEQMKYESIQYCADHKCSVQDCKLMKEEPIQYCYLHCCRHHKCEQMRLEHSGYCFKHRYDGTIEFACAICMICIMIAFAALLIP
jgi:hypothetical protein